MMAPLRAVMGALVLVLGARGLTAQGLDSAEAARCGLVGRRVTAHDTLFAIIPPRDPRQSDTEYGFLAAQVRAVLRTFGAPMALGPGDSIRPFLRTPPATTVDPWAEALLWFQVGNDGHLTGLALERPSKWRELDLELARAILRADSLGRLLPLPPALRGQAVDLRLDLQFAPATTLERTPVGIRTRTAFDYDTTGHTFVLPRLLRRPDLHFPDAALGAGVGDSLLFEFTIDTTGHVRDVLLRQATFRDFAVEASRVIERAEFEPARIDACKVRIRVCQSVRFRFRPW